MSWKPARIAPIIWTGGRMDESDVNELQQALLASGVPRAAAQDWNGEHLLRFIPGNSVSPWRASVSGTWHVLTHQDYLLKVLKDRQIDYLLGEETPRVSAFKQRLLEPREAVPGGRIYEAEVRCACGWRHVWFTQAPSISTKNVECQDCRETHELKVPRESESSPRDEGE
jgi:hypothetical protein